MTTHPIETTSSRTGRHGAASALAARVRGAVITPADPEYDQARSVWNGMIERWPAVILRPADALDVSAAIQAARSYGLQLVVRGGGHNVAGFATGDDALVIDLRDMRTVLVDPQERIARVQGGATWADVDEAAQTHGLVTPGGVVSETGVGGFTLSGGMGHLRRRFGLTVDNLVGAEVVLADGRIVEADEHQHPDLFWALRGGGGNFGVVTGFDFRLHPFGPGVDVAFTFYRLDEAQRIVATIMALAPTMPDGIAPLLVFGRAPADAPFPSEVRGQPYVAVLALNGEEDSERGAATMARLRSLARPLADLSQRTSYVEAQRMLDADYPSGGRYYWKSASLARLDDEAVRRIALQVHAMPEGHSTVDLWVQGGAIARVATGATAFADRQTPFLVNVEANWHHPEDDERHIAWARRTLDALTPWRSGSSYLNFPGLLEEGEGQVKRAFGSNYGRLARIKAAYDPTNLFRRNQNVRPAAEPAEIAYPN